MGTNLERRPKGWAIERALMRSMEERFERDGVSDAIIEYMTTGDDPFDPPLIEGRARKRQRIKRNGGDDAGGADDSLDAQTLSVPPTANRGSTFHVDRNGDTNDDCPRVMGGYDGGVEMGFDGQWVLPERFKKLLKRLERAKKAAQEKKDADRFIEIQGQQFLVSPKAASGGVNYTYRLEGDGMVLLIHETPTENIQPIRLKYTATGLIGRDIFVKHAKTRTFIRKLGFEVTDEKLSRVDLQVMLFHRYVTELTQAQNEKRIVCTARKGSVIWDGDAVETYNRGRLIQLCVYDKRTELFNGMKSEAGAQKYALMVRECFGEEWEREEIPTLRVEFRLRREVLRDMEIDSMDDLLEKESDLVHWLTHKWFRIITEPKKRGHTHEQETTEFWREVQEAFEKWFPGADGHRSKVERKRRETPVTSIDNESDIAQACGCLAAAISKELGETATPEESIAYAISKLRERSEFIHHRATERTRDRIVRTSNVVRFLKTKIDELNTEFDAWEWNADDSRSRVIYFRHRTHDPEFDPRPVAPVESRKTLEFACNDQ